MITRSEAAARRDLGMERVSEKAERDVPMWSDLAIAFLRNFAARRDDEFLVEDVRAAADAWGLAQPENAKAWGPVMLLAARLGIVRRCGYARAKSSNLSPKVLWRRA